MITTKISTLKFKTKKIDAEKEIIKAYLEKNFDALNITIYFDFSNLDLNRENLSNLIYQNGFPYSQICRKMYKLIIDNNQKQFSIKMKYPYTEMNYRDAKNFITKLKEFCIYSNINKSENLEDINKEVILKC